MAVNDAQWLDQAGHVRLVGQLQTAAAIGLPTGWTEDASDPANVNAHAGTLTLDDLTNQTVIEPLGVQVGSDTTDEVYRMEVGEGITSAADTGVPCFTAAVGEGATIALDAGGLLVSNLATPAGANDATRKTYVDTADALLAPLASPTFTGVPAADTAAKGTTTTQLATTAFVGNILLSGSGAPTVFVAPLYYDTTAVTGGLYAWDGAAYVHVSAVV